MNQDFAAPAIQKINAPSKPRKNFCFATIPFILIALISVFQCVRQSTFIPSNWFELLDNIDYKFEVIARILYLAFLAFVFIGSVFISIALFAKENNALPGIPLLMISAGYLFDSIGSFVWSYTFIYGEYAFYDNFPDAFLDMLPSILLSLSASFALLAPSVYIFIVASRKKPAPKLLWLIPAIICGIFIFPRMINEIITVITYIRYIINGDTYCIKFLPDIFIEPLLVIAVILLLIWFAFPYKKEKQQKPIGYQPVHATVPVMPKTAATPVQPATKPEPHPVPQPSVSTPAPQPPVEKPAVQPEADSDAERQRTNIQLLKEYKELLDGGVITQEDFDKKKKDLLGI